MKFKDGKVLICNSKNGEDICSELEENYLPEHVSTEARCGKTEFKIDD